MENFIAYNPVKIHFGKGVLNQLGETAAQYGKRALLVMGKGSVKRIGIYDVVLNQLEAAGIEIIEFSGIKPNPLIDDVRNAASLGIEKDVELVIGLGGGSVIDSSKIIAAAIAEKADAWEIVSRQIRQDKALPVISILTLAATGTEMNQFGVIQNPETREKIGYGHPSLYPRHSFLDPQYTTSVDNKNTAYGITDLMAHAMESYFGIGEAPLADAYIIAILKEAIAIAQPLLNNLHDYDLRARMMWAATNALNGYPSYGRKMGDWAVHGLGHPISMLFDTPHGATLSIVYPAWMSFLSNHQPDRIAHLGKEVFQVNGVEESIQAFKDFFKSIGTPTSLEDASITGNQRNMLLELWIEKGARGNLFELKREDYEFLLSKI